MAIKTGFAVFSKENNQLEELFKTDKFEVVLEGENPNLIVGLLLLPYLFGYKTGVSSL